MPFPSNVKARIFVKSARMCALCFKQCGTGIEAAHIVAEADGGTNDDENAIPLCFDCHQEVGSYNPRHPKGNSFTDQELRQRRDALYSLVERGVIQAQIVAHRLEARQPIIPTPAATSDIVTEAARPFVPSAEAVAVLKEAEKAFAPVETLPRKLALLCREDRAFIVDQLVEGAVTGPAISALMLLISQEVLENQEVVVLEALLRKMTLRGDAAARARFMNLVPVQTLAKTEAEMRTAFFEDVFEIMRRDQYSEVNQVTPAVIKVQEAIPQTLTRRYVEALIGQAESGAWQGAPTAKRALRELPASMSSDAFDLLDAKRLLWCSEPEFVKEFLSSHRDDWPTNRRQMYSDFLDLNPGNFAEKYFQWAN